MSRPRVFGYHRARYSVTKLRSPTDVGIRKWTPMNVFLLIILSIAYEKINGSFERKLRTMLSILPSPQSMCTTRTPSYRKCTSACSPSHWGLRLGEYFVMNSRHFRPNSGSKISLIQMENLSEGSNRERMRKIVFTLPKWPRLLKWRHELKWRRELNQRLVLNCRLVLNRRLLLNRRLVLNLQPVLKQQPVPKWRPNTKWPPGRYQRPLDLFGQLKPQTSTSMPMEGATMEFPIESSEFIRAA